MKIWFPLVLAALALIACGEDTETVQVTDRYTLDMLGKGVSLTEEKCDSTRTGQLLYVGDSSSIYYCTGKAWKKANGKDGKDGRDGKDGTDGTDGKKGENGTSGTDCFIEDFSEGFVLGCGATKAVVRYDFELPDTCHIALRSDSSYVLTCGKDTAMLVQGPQGDAGDICKQTDIGGGQVRLVCGSDSVTLFRAACGETPFDPEGPLFCYGDSLVERCNTHIYDIKKQFCYGDSIVDFCDGKKYELNKDFCFADSLVDLCGGKSYDLKQRFCSGDSLVDLCGGEDYTLTEQFCYGDSLVDLCGGEDYELTEQFCSGDSLVDLCDGKDYKLTEQFCYGDSLVDLCDGKDYELTEKFCSGDSIVDLCDGRDYDLSQEFCYGDSIVSLCGGKDYDLNLELCQNNEVAPVFCGSEKYDESLQFCYNDSLVDLCGGETYDVESQFCYEKKHIVPLCNGKTFNPFNYICEDGMIFGRCDGMLYPADREFCFAGQIYSLCGQEYRYDPEEFICKDGNVFMGLCGGIEYELADSTCYNGEVVPKCPAELEKNEFCDGRNGRVYKFTSIGGRDWMAENLDYRIPKPRIPDLENMSRSFCEQRAYDYDLYCGPKGRYYPWHVAMAKDVRVCGEGHVCTEENPQEYVQGICPDGWHLPFWEEWQAVVQIMGDRTGDYWDESVEIAQNRYSSNPYGFSAFPTGFYSYTNIDGSEIEGPPKDVSYPYIASYWSSSEYRGEASAYSSLSTKSHVYAATFDLRPEDLTKPVARVSPATKQNARTVRCVRD